MQLSSGTANVNNFCHAFMRLLLLWKSLHDWSSVKNRMEYHTFILQYYSYTVPNMTAKGKKLLQGQKRRSLLYYWADSTRD